MKVGGQVNAYKWVRPGRDLSNDLGSLSTFVREHFSGATFDDAVSAANAYAGDIVVVAQRGKDRFLNSSAVITITNAVNSLKSNENVGRSSLNVVAGMAFGSTGQTLVRHVSDRNAAATGRALKDVGRNAVEGLKAVGELASPIPNQTKANLIEAGATTARYVSSRTSFPALAVNDVRGFGSYVSTNVSRIASLDSAGKQEFLFYAIPRVALEALSFVAGGEVATLGRGSRIAGGAADRVGADLVASRPSILSDASLSAGDLAYATKQFARKEASILRAGDRGELVFSPGTNGVRIESLQASYRDAVAARYESMYGQPLDLRRLNADHPVDLIIGGSPTQPLRMLNESVNKSVGSSLRQAAKRAGL